MTDEILYCFDEDRCSIMLFMDLGAAFYTIDTNTTVETLAVIIGLSGTALRWCKSLFKSHTEGEK